MTAGLRIIRTFNGQFRGSETVARNLEVKENPLWFHKAGLTQTASGYGKKLATPYMVKLNNRWYRIYNSCFSNSGTLYIQSKQFSFTTREKKDIVVELHVD